MIRKNNNYNRVSKISCVDIARDHGMTLRQSGSEYICDSYRCPQDDPSDYTSTKKNRGNYLHIDPVNNRWHDLVTEESGYAVQFQIYFEHEDFDVRDHSIYNLAIHELAKKYGVELEEDSRIRQATKHQKDLIDTWTNNLLVHDDGIKYIMERLNLKEEAARDCIKRNKIGITYYWNSERIVTPYLTEIGDPTFYQGRAIDDEVSPKYAYAKTSEWGERPLLWGQHTLSRKKDLIICEGIFDALTCEVEGYSVLSPLSISFNPDKTGAAIAKYAKVANKQDRDVIIIFDNDFKPGVKKNAGQEAALDLAIALFENGIDFKVSTTPNGIKDVNEYYLQNGNVDSLFTGATPGLEYLCNKLSPNDLKSLVKKHSRSEKLDYSLKELINIAEGNDKFSGALISTLKDLVKTPPKASKVANEFIRKYNVIFKSNDGFYIYQDNRWLRFYDEEVDKLIDQLLGKFSSSAKIADIAKLVAARCVSRVEFNKKELVGFENGTLDLKTGEFRESRPEDYITGQCPYEYDPTATCPKWLEYLKQVLGDNEEGQKLARLLQQFTGYILVPDCRYQKALFLYGRGSNGKSVFLNTIKKLWAPELVTSVFLGQFSQDFSRISLQNSYVNIANENESRQKFEGNADYWKSIVAGDPINACYKHKDYITFETRAKLIFSDNDMPRTTDRSFGQERRWIFIPFTKKFSDEPELKPGELRADPFLEMDLVAELPGIFNWAFNGYLDLSQSKGFIIPESSKKLREEVKENNNPVLRFVKSMIINQEDVYERTPGYLIFTGDEYDGNYIRARFTEFAEDNGHSSRPATNTFKREFIEALEDVYPGVFSVEKRRVNGAYWVIKRNLPDLEKMTPQEQTQYVLNGTIPR